MTVQADVAAELKTSSVVTVQLADGPGRSVAVDNIRDAFGALQACQADLLKSWGIDPAEGDKIKAPARPAGVSPGDWIVANDYPGDALVSRAQGTSTILWSIDTEGGIAECRVVESSGNASLDRASCDALKLRGHYKPAIGLDGKPIVSHQMRAIVWQLP